VSALALATVADAGKLAAGTLVGKLSTSKVTAATAASLD
jgi:hypothetical protein